MSTVNPPPPRSRPGARNLTIALAAAGVLVVVIAVLILAESGSSSSSHAMDANLEVGTVDGPVHGSHFVLAGIEGGSPAGAESVTMSIQLTLGPGVGADVFRRGGWFCFPVTQEKLIHCAPPGYLQRGAPDVPLAVFDRTGKTYLGTEDLIRNDVYKGERCPLEGGGPYHKTPKGYVACHQFPILLVLHGGPFRGTAKDAADAGWLCFPITVEGLIHCAPPGYLQRNAADVPLLVFDGNGDAMLGPEDLVRNDAYHGQPCRFEGGGPYHKTPKGYVACHEFPLNVRTATHTLKFAARIVQRLDSGAIESTASGTMAPGGNGTIVYSGSGDVTGGKRHYGGAKGHYRLSGTMGANGNGTFTLTGNVKY